MLRNRRAATLHTGATPSLKYLPLVCVFPNTEQGQGDGGNIEKLSKDQIALCSSRGLDVRGNKPDLAARLSAAPQLLALMPPPLPLAPPPPPVDPPPLLGQEEELEQEGEESDSDSSDSNDGGEWRGD